MYEIRVLVLINSPGALCASSFLAPHAKACISRSGTHAERKRLTEARRPASSSCILEHRCWKWKSVRIAVQTTRAMPVRLLLRRLQQFICNDFFVLFPQIHRLFFPLWAGVTILPSHHVIFNSLASEES